MKKILLLTLITIGFGGISLPYSVAQSVADESNFTQVFSQNFKFLDNRYLPYHLPQVNFFESTHSVPLRIGDLSWSDDNLNSESDVNWTAFTITSAAIAGFYTGLFIREQQRRWSPTKVPFYFNSPLEAKGFDKFGHFYATKIQASFISNLYDFSGVSRNASALLGAGIALSVQSLIEIKDGRISSGGFDVYDQTANILGTSWFYARERVDFLQRFDVRWFYYPSEEKDLLEPNTRFNEDYGGHSYWLSMRTWDLFPEKARFWPKFIVPAAGISLNNWTGEEAQTEHISYHLSINPDFNHILPQDTRVGRFLTDILNGFYIPAPAVELYPDFGFKLIFYGQ